MKNRLTSRNENGDVLINEFELLLNDGGKASKDDFFKVAMHLAERLAEYEELDEKKRLVELPCSVGDRVYHVSPPFVLEYEVTGFTVDETGAWLMQAEHYDKDTDKTYGNSFELHKLNDTVFLSEKDASERLDKTRED